MSPSGGESVWDFDGGLLPLDFANTAEWHAAPQPVERLTSYADLVDWSLAAGVLAERDGQELLAAAGTGPPAARAVFKQAIELREDIYHIFSAIARGEAPAAESMLRFNAALARALSSTKIDHNEKGFSWSWAGSDLGLDRMFGPIVRATAELLTSDDLQRVGECQDDRGCGYLFFDTSRNRSRRWCNMESCGNRAKARRHYARLKDRSQS